MAEYIPLRKRRPAVRFNLCRMVVEDAVSLLFGDGRFPAIDCPDAATRNALTRLVAETGLVAAMMTRRSGARSARWCGPDPGDFAARIGRKLGQVA